MQFRPLFLLLILFCSACSSQPVRLYLLKEEEPASYQHLEEAVALANEFLATSTYAHGFPAEQAHFSMGLNDILLHLKGEGIQPLRIETAGWGDMRTVFGDGVHPTEQGFLSARRTNADATGQGFSDSAFLQLSTTDMAALLLRQATTLREMQARGSFDYWLNYDLLGFNPDSGWMERNVVDRRAYAVQAGFYQWLQEKEQAALDAAATTADDSGQAQSEAEAAAGESVLLPPVPAPGGGNYPEPDLP